MVDALATRIVTALTSDARPYPPFEDEQQEADYLAIRDLYRAAKSEGCDFTTAAFRARTDFVGDLLRAWKDEEVALLDWIVSRVGVGGSVTIEVVDGEVAVRSSGGPHFVLCVRPTVREALTAAAQRCQAATSLNSPKDSPNE